MAIPNMLLVTNGKGGVGKTSLTANLAGLAAQAGWDVLAVDLDTQGNLARDLGYLDQSDGGQALLAAVLLGQEISPIDGVRRGPAGGQLDVIAGGPSTARLSDQLTIEVGRLGPAAYRKLGEVIAPLASGYDLVVCDMPPGDSTLQRAATRSARWVVIPTTPDDAAIDGLGRIYSELALCADENPTMQVLGVALTLVVPGATAVERRARNDLRALLGDSVPIFERTIRFAQAAAVGCRSKGVLANEYEAAAAAATPWYKARESGQTVERFSSAAARLAEDYQLLVDEILAAVSTSTSSASAALVQTALGQTRLGPTHQSHTAETEVPA